MSKVFKSLKTLHYKFPEVEVPRLESEGCYNVSAKIHLDEFDDLCFYMTIEGLQERSNLNYYIVDEPIVNSCMTENELLSLFDKGLQRLTQRLMDPNEEAFFADNYL